MSVSVNNIVTRQGRQHAGMPRARARYLVQALALEERDNTSLISQGILLTTLLTIGLIVWAALTDVNEIARASGEVVPAGLVQSVQHLEGGIVADLQVKNGARVQAGDVLLQIADAGARSELAQLATRRASLDLRLRRLDALLASEAPDFDGLQAPYTPEMIALQREVFLTQRDSGLAQLQLIRAERGRLLEERDASAARVDALMREVSLVRQEQERQEVLLARRLVAAADVTNVRLTALRTQGDLHQAQGEWGSLQRQIEASVQRERELESRRRESWNLEREEVKANLDEVQAQLAALRDRTQRLDLRATVDGVVQALAVSGPGAVIQPGQTVLQIVPGDTRLLVHARVSPDDIGHLEVGQSVDVKVSSYEPQRYGTLVGELTQVSPSTQLNEERQPYYQAEVELQRLYLGNDPQRHQLVPGMLVQADIITGRKSILDYLLKPVYRGFSGAMKER